MATRTSTPQKAGRTHQGVVRAIVAVTGVEDQVGDVIHPGIFTAALQRRWPKVVFHHNFQDFAGRVTKAEEWLPGDKRLPKKQPNGQKWPETAGALVVTMQFNLATERGREVFEWARFYAASNECAWSIGYTVPAGMSAKRAAVRHIYGIDVFEVSLVLHGANSLTSALEVKSAATRELERKTAPMGMFTPALGRTAAQAVVEAKAHPAGGDLVATGLAVKATDTGRVLLLQRALDDDDPASGRWEFPGGHLDDGEDPLAGATREWQEEVGTSLPRGQVTATWDSPNGKWRGFLYVVPSESSVKVNADHEDRVKRNPDDPKGKNVETVAWWDVTTLPGMPALRDEMHTTPWSTLVTPTREIQVETKGDRSPIGSPGDRENWVDQVGGLPLYIREIAHALIREGHPESQAIRMAVGAVQRWARGADDVKPDTIAKATAAVAEWEAKKAAAHADNTVERKSAAQVVAEAKALTPQEGKTMRSSSMGGSFEETLHKVREAVRAHHTGKDGKKKGDAYCYVAVNATFPDSVIYTVTGGDGGGKDARSYRAGYTIADNGDVTLAAPVPVTLQVIAVDGGPAQDAPSPAATLTDSTMQALREAAAAMVAAPLEVKHLNALAPAATAFLDVLAEKGMDTAALVYGDEDDEDEIDPGLDESTESTEYDDTETDTDRPGPQIGVDIEETPADELTEDVEVKDEDTWGALTAADTEDDEDPDLEDEDEDEDGAVSVDRAEIDAELDELRAA